MAVIITASNAVSATPKDGIGLARAVEKCDGSFPILARALQNVEPAGSTKVEWDVGEEHWFNWTMIFRQPFGVTNTELATDSYGASEKFADEVLGEHLRSIESDFHHGVLGEKTSYHWDEDHKRFWPYTTHTMGGTQFYLGREPKRRDYIGLRILRDCFLMETTPPDFDGRKWEYLSEISLVVKPG